MTKNNLIWPGYRRFYNEMFCLYVMGHDSETGRYIYHREYTKDATVM